MNIRLEPVTKENWEEVLKLKVHAHQEKFVPLPAESLAVAYIKPWDEAVDPYAIYVDKTMAGLYYLSYTPGSPDNYWIGGFIIDKNYQGKGYGKAALMAILKQIKQLHPNCRVAKLTVEKDNDMAQKLYKGLGFSDTGKTNKYDEIIYELPVE
ncbi:MAG: GNAT family N-acetyltransferase [candidate division Zixibacteria bacterium]|nr:GNAT family N-acetyltransferase [candidate division Zixibacteria bacterium]